MNQVSIEHRIFNYNQSSNDNFQANILHRRSIANALTQATWW